MNIDNMVNRFLSWKLPEDFSPDCYIKFTTSEGGAWPIGTNLLTAPQAVEMFKYVTEPARSNMTFGDAIDSLKNGKKVSRSGWNGSGMFVFLVNGSKFNVSRPPLLGIFQEGHEINYRPHIDIKNVDGSISTWAPSIGDVLAEDWSIAE